MRLFGFLIALFLILVIQAVAQDVSAVTTMSASGQAAELDWKIQLVPIGLAVLAFVVAFLENRAKREATAQNVLIEKGAKFIATWIETWATKNDKAEIQVAAVRAGAEEGLHKIVTDAGLAKGTPK